MMRSTVTTITIVALTSAVLVSPVRADKEDARRKERAKALWEEGAVRYDAGKFEEAIDLLSKAYEIWPYSEILFNLCQSHRQLKKFERAIFYCKSYLRNKSDAQNRDEVVGIVAEMDKIVAAQDDTSRLPPKGLERPAASLHPTRDVNSENTQLTGPGAAAKAASGRPWYADRWAWAVTGSGVAISLAGTGLLVWAASIEDDGDATMNQADAKPLYDEADTKRTLGAVFTVAGAAITIGGIAMLAWNPHAEAQPSVEVVLRPAGIVLQGWF